MTQSTNAAQFDSLGRFILEDFDHARPFSSFLPGIAGLYGIPMWVFYVNRGQGICSFGVEDKDHPIFEFQSANKAYQTTSLIGFRTFMNGMRDGKMWSCEAFSPWKDEIVDRKMFIGMNEFEVQEVNQALGIQINVLYFLLPNLPFSGLVRRIEVQNIGGSSLKLEVLDGLPEVIPYGINNDFLKNMGRTIEAWMCVDHLEEDLPFYRLKATPGDTTAVETIQDGNFALSFNEGRLLAAFADPKVVFGLDTGCSDSHQFHDQGLQGLLAAEQITEGHGMCAFFGGSLQMAPGETKTLTSLFGTAKSHALIQGFHQEIMADGFIDAKLEEARNLAVDLTDKVRTESGNQAFNGFCRQSFLDNLIRGGTPIRLGDEKIYHVYSRKHGDIERDYNYFVLPPKYYSQGNGNYRDINQNRRNDVFFVPEAGIVNIWLFMSLIQADGYNPLVINGITYSIAVDQIPELLAHVKEPGLLEKIMGKPFSPGELVQAAMAAGLSISVEEFLHQVIAVSETKIQAEHGEGYWIDHWTYNLDLIEAYLAVFPDRLEDLLFHSKPLPFYDNDHVVQPRRERYVLQHGKPRQSNAVVRDADKAALIASREGDPHWARADHGRGDIFTLPLVSKLALLALIKFASRDPSGMGIEMEAGKPGWYDALNGLPGLFGSSMPETCELLRLVNFLKDVFEDSSYKLGLPLEAKTLLDAVGSLPDDPTGSLADWDHLASGLESYRESIRLGFDGETLTIPPVGVFTKMEKHLEDGIARSKAFTIGIPPTYFRHRVTDYELLGTEDADGNLHIVVREFIPETLPPFLEGPVRLLKVSNHQEARDLVQAVNESELFDKKLKMYKVNGSLKQETHEIGRAHAFTPGWLENESIWMHMSFKFLLEMLQNRLFDEYYQALKAHLPAFMDPNVYGRSPLENSSFIVSSAHPDACLHGNGFVARLSGSTAEFLSLWRLMTVGQQPFQFQEGALSLRFDPALAGWLFGEDGSFTFQFLGACDVTLINLQGLETYHEGFEIEKIRLHGLKEVVELNEPVIPSPYAGLVRAGKIKKIECFYPSNGA